MHVSVWPKAITEWHVGGTGYLSVPFTWCLPEAKRRVLQTDLFIKHWVVGGPAVRLMPDFDLPGASLEDMEGVLQRVNPQATRTTIGCPNACGFCGVKQIEPVFQELGEWPDLPILCDNNLLACSLTHFDRVMDRLVRHGWCDFSQGIDACLLTPYHAERIAEVKKAIVRLALDHDAERDRWVQAVECLKDAGVAKSRIRSYVLVGFTDGPQEGWERCKFVESYGVKPLPMWFHALDTLEHNVVTSTQKHLGWTNQKRRELFCWFYQHRTLDKRG